MDKIDPNPSRTIECELPAVLGLRSTTLAEIWNERCRQVCPEGYDAAHDDAHTRGEIALMAASYAALAGRSSVAAIYAWPWDEAMPKSLTSEPRRQLIIAGALILAEIERIDRAAIRETSNG